MLDSAILPALLAALAVLTATFVLADFFLYLSKRYRERFIAEATLELDDILLQMPASRVLDFSLALMACGAFAAVLAVSALMEDFNWLAGGIAALVGASVCFPLPRLILRRMRRKRLDKFNDQLEDALGTMSSSLKAGFSIMQALEEVAAGKKHPISIEFRLLVQEIQLGVPLERALDNMCQRIGSEDFELVTLSIITARQTGGELPAALDRLSGMIRERIRIQQKIRALTAMGKLQATVISLMPFVLLLGLLYVMPRAPQIFFGTGYGWLALGVVVMLVTLGHLVIRKIIRIDI